MNTIAILKKAKQLLIDKGWTQGAYGRKNGLNRLSSQVAEGDFDCLCGWGACIAASQSDAFDAALEGAMKALDRASDKHFPSFNDAPGRTVDEVLAKFDEAIAAEEAKAQA